MKKLQLEELNRISSDEFKQKQKFPIVVILDNIRSALNVGSVFRTCDAFNISKVYLCGITACPPNKEINKTAIGASETVVWEYCKDITTIVDRLKSEGYTMCAIEQTDQSIQLNSFDVKLNAKYALILGNEVDGVAEEILPSMDFAIEIPQFGTKHSLNVSVCAGIVLWHFIVTQTLNE